MIYLCAFLGASGSGAAFDAVVEVEEMVYTWEDSKNGSFPQWTYGSTVLTRVGDDLFFSATETIPDAIPLNNVRWALMKRTDEGWVELQRDETDRTREDCPIAAFPNGRIFLSVNPTLTGPDARNGPAHPLVLQFSASDPTAPPQALQPVWDGEPAFTEHSYRSFACDPDRRELLLVNVVGYEGQHWSFRNAEGQWCNCGMVSFPEFDSFKGPVTMRYLYPNLALRDGAAHMFTKGGIEDIVEERYNYRKEKGMKIWMRPSLGYAWSPNIAEQPFSEWINAVDVIETSGEVWNCDLWVAANGDCHLLWWEASIDARLRPAFFADIPLTWSLKHGVMRQGEMAFSEILVEGGEGLRPEKPRWGRFHVTEDERLFCFYSLYGPGECEHPGWTNWLMEIKADGTHEGAVKVDLEHPMGTLFMTASPYGGTAPSEYLEIVGRPVDIPLTVNYARIKVTD